MTRAVIILALLIAAGAGVATSAGSRAHACAFTVAPTAYEPGADRSVPLLGMELSAYNMVAPTDSFFGIPTVETGVRGSRSVADDPYVPPILLKATGWIESSIAQSDYNTPFGAVGPALVSFDCGHGIMQVTSGMTSAADGFWPSRQQALVATHYLYNIGRGTAILVDKWNAAPQVRPIAGTDTDSDPEIIENWYFAVWSYNGFTGPGANRSNHPMDPDYSWPRTGFSCGPSNDGYGHSYGNYPYQELVFGCASRPPTVASERLWDAPSVPLALPDIGVSTWSNPLSLDNFVYPYENMDIRSPAPWHHDQTEQPPAGTTAFLTGSPTMWVSTGIVDQAVNDVVISNIGSGILAWRAKHAENWIAINKQGGVALGPQVPCADGSPCTRSATLRITVGAAPAGSGPATVQIQNLTSGNTVNVVVMPVTFQQPTPTRTPRPPTPPPSPLYGDANCQNDVNAVDAALILQFSAGLVSSVPCANNADVNVDGYIDPIDSALILQHVAGIIAGLGP